MALLGLIGLIVYLHSVFEPGLGQGRADTWHPFSGSLPPPAALCLKPPAFPVALSNGPLVLALPALSCVFPFVKEQSALETNPGAQSALLKWSREGEQCFWTAMRQIKLQTFKKHVSLFTENTDLWARPEQLHSEWSNIFPTAQLHDGNITPPPRAVAHVHMGSLPEDNSSS